MASDVRTGNREDVLAQCVATPDDDGPRLVWADLVGGERGELVVIQCAIARGQLSASELVSYRARERELLASYGVEWAGSLAGAASRWWFRRGFVAAARVDLASELPAGWLDDAPLVRSLAVTGWEVPQWFDAIGGLLGSLRGLALVPTGSSWTPGARRDLANALHQIAGTASQLRALSVPWVANRISDAPSERDLLAVLTQSPIEQLALPGHGLMPSQITEVVRCTPRLHALAIDQPIGVKTVTSLRIEAAPTPDGETLARWYPRLSQLAVRHDVSAIDQLPRLLSLVGLRRLELTGEHCAAALTAYLDRTVEWRAPDELIVHGALDASLCDRAARELADLTTLYASTERLATDWTSSPDEIFASEPPCCHPMPAAVVARLDTPAVWSVGGLPIDDRVVIGRSLRADIRLVSAMVARFHAAIRWQSGRYVLCDLGSDNGTFVGGAMITAPVALADELEFVIANIPLRFYTGPDARERAAFAINRR